MRRQNVEETRQRQLPETLREEAEMRLILEHQLQRRGFLPRMPTKPELESSQGGRYVLDKSR